MRKIDFTPENKKEIAVNDKVFALCVDDAELLEIRAEMATKVAEIDPQQTEGLVSFSRHIESVVDRILGEGAFAEISQGRPVATIKKIEFCASLIREASNALFDGLVEEND